MTKSYKIKKVSSVIKDIINQDQLIDGINNIKVINSWKKIVGKNIISSYWKLGLDQERVSLIIEKVKQNNFGQIFITDTHYDRTVNALSKNKSEYSIFEL